MGLSGRSLILLVILILILAFATRVSFSAPTYSSQNFDVYDNAGAGSAYAQSVANAFEAARSALVNRGVGLSPPCNGNKYAVYIQSLSGSEAGLTTWQYSYDPNTGKILSTCIVDIKIAPGLSQSVLTHTAYHEMNHVAQLAYVQYKNVLESYPWYVEASAEGVAGALSGICGWEPSYFLQYNLYTTNPYSFSNAAPQSYAYGAFYNWVISSGYAGAATSFSASFSGSSVISDWINSAYTSFLLALAKGVQICGTTYRPSYQQVTLAPSGWSTQFSLDGLSAKYFTISLPSPGLVTISTTGTLRSNLALNQPFYVSNGSLILALVNPSLSQANYQVSITFSPPLTAEIRDGVFNPIDRTLQLRLYVTYAGKPVDGAVLVNGTTLTASSGYVDLTLQGVSWGVYPLSIEYSGEKTTITVSVEKPSLQLVTPTPLYLSSSAYGSIITRVINPNKFKVLASLKVVEPKVDNQSILVYTNVPQSLTLQPGATEVRIEFKTVGSISRASGKIILQLDPANNVEASLPVEPASLAVTLASYNSESDKTIVSVIIQPLSLQTQVQISGFSGSVAVPYATYYVGVVTVDLPRYTVTLTASPKIVAPRWLLASVNATVFTSSCPAYPVEYEVTVRVNSSIIGVSKFQCGSKPQLSTDLNFTLNQLNDIILIANGNPSWSTRVAVKPPRIAWRILEWRVLDNGSLVRLLVNVSGPHKYLVLGHQVYNGSITLETFLPAPEKQLRVDIGFETLRTVMPNVTLSLRTPEVAIYPTRVKSTLIVNTSSYLDAFLEVLLDGTQVKKIRITGSGSIMKELELEPEAPGEHAVTVSSWFAEESRKFFYVRVEKITVNAPPLRLIGAKAETKIIINSHPPLPLPINVSLKGCEEKTFQLHGNSSLTLSFDKVCSLRLTASILNYTAATTITWDKINLGLEEVLGFIDSTAIIPTGAVSGYAVFANGTRIPAPVKVNGQENYTIAQLGKAVLTLSVEYMGCSNSTSLEVFLVPKDTYLRSLGMVNALGRPRALDEQLRLAVVSGNWKTINSALEVYEKSSEATAAYDPLRLLSRWLLEKWASEGDPSLLALSEWITRNEVPLYAVMGTILAATILLLKKKFRRKTSMKGRELGQEDHNASAAGSV